MKLRGIPPKLAPFLLLCLAGVNGCDKAKNEPTSYAGSPAPNAQPTETNEPAPEAPEEDDTFKVLPDPQGRQYFPKRTASYYTRYLAAMKEPSVQGDLEEGVDAVIRFTYLRSFHSPIVVRITRQKRIDTCRAVILELDENYRPTRISHDETMALAEDASRKLDQILNDKSFWTPVTELEEAVMRGRDGSQWIFEIHDAAGYRMVDLWSPDALERMKSSFPQPRDFKMYKDRGVALLNFARVAPADEELY